MSCVSAKKWQAKMSAFYFLSSGKRQLVFRIRDCSQLGHSTLLVSRGQPLFPVLEEQRTGKRGWPRENTTL